MSWQILLAISIITYSFSIIIQKGVLKSNKIDPIAYAVFFSFPCAIWILLYAAFQEFSLAHIENHLHNVVFMIILNSFGNFFMFKSLKLIDVSEYTILFTSRAVWAIFAAIFILDEHFSLLQFIGTILVILSIVIVSWKKKEFHLTRGEIYAILTSICFGFSFVNDAFITRDVSPVSYLPITFIIPAVVL